MNELGFVKLHRQMTEWEWYKDNSVKSVLIHLLLIANYKDGRFKGRLIKRGQVVTSQAKLAEALGMNKKTIKKCLDKLEATGEVVCEATKMYTIITVTNYDLYQGGPDSGPYSGPYSGVLSGPLDGPHHGPQYGHNQRKKEKKERKNTLAHSVRESVFSSPSLSEVEAYADERGASGLALEFYEFYESNGWMVGKNKMRNWKMAFNGWIRRHKDDIDDTPKTKTKMNIL